MQTVERSNAETASELLGDLIELRGEVVREGDELLESWRPRVPEIIVQGAGAQPLAVMTARGDLAVEIGFGRLAEIQEEILWPRLTLLRSSPSRLAPLTGRPPIDQLVVPYARRRSSWRCNPRRGRCPGSVRRKRSRGT